MRKTSLSDVCSRPQLADKMSYRSTNLHAVSLPPPLCPSSNSWNQLRCITV